MTETHNEHYEAHKNSTGKLIFLLFVILVVALLSLSVFGNLNLDNKKVDEGKQDDVVMPVATSTNDEAGAKMVIKIALLADPGNLKFVNNKKVACDAIVMLEREIESTPQVLNAAMEELFKFKGPFTATDS